MFALWFLEMDLMSEADKSPFALRGLVTRFGEQTVH